MTDQVISSTVTSADQRIPGLSFAAWMRTDAVGLGLAYGALALFGDGAEAPGADYRVGRRVML